MFLADVAYYYRAWKPSTPLGVFDTRRAALRLAIAQAWDDRQRNKLEGA